MTSSSSRVLLPRCDGGRLPAAKVDRVEAVAHLSLVVALVLGAVQAQLSGEVLSEALHVPTVKEGAPAHRFWRGVGMFQAGYVGRTSGRHETT